MRKLKNEELGRMDIPTFQSAEKLNVCVILDNIRSMHNVGSVFRTSDAFRVEKVWLCGITGQPPHREIYKTALGATDSVTWEYQENILVLFDKLRAEGWKIISVEQADNSVSLTDFSPKPSEKYAFIFGNEVFGVKEELVSASDTVLEIPQFGTKHSLNISVSYGVVIWDVFQKLKGAIKF